LERWRVSS